jgi:hypothetical protein
MSNYRRVLAVSLFVIGCSMLTGAGDTQPNGPTIGAAPPGPHCPWEPVQQSLPAGGQCGFNDAGAPNPGIFQCGLVSNGNACVNHCVFVRCQD